MLVRSTALYLPRAAPESISVSFKSYFVLPNISTLPQGPVSRIVSLFRFVDILSMWFGCVSAGALTFGILSDSWPSFRDVSRGER